VTPTTESQLDKYLQEIGKADLLTPDEEVTYAQRIRDGDQQALEKLTTCVSAVVPVAKQYQNQGLRWATTTVTWSHQSRQAL
jgi:RNA polymerase primary sigma factor